MNTDEALTTSPLLFGYSGRGGRLAAVDARSGDRFRLAGVRAAEIVAAFLEPRSPAEAAADGFGAEELEAAREAGLLVSVTEAEQAGRWERSGWSRAGFLLFSQMDIKYAEWDVPGRSPTAARREQVTAYRDGGARPDRQLLASGEPVALPPAPETSEPLSALTERRSVRGFAPEPPPAEAMAGVLNAPARAMRAMAADRARPDPLRELNSFYSWAHLFVVVQDVQGIAPGAYEYDWREHRLIEAAPPPSDDALLACVHGQGWVLGTGFAVFVVADMRRLAWLYRHSRAYLHLLTQVGSLGQELLTAATELGLGGWTSPAVHEARCAKALGIPDDDGLDVLSIVKLGPPKG